MVQGRDILVGCHLRGRTESDTTEVTQQQRQCESESVSHSVVSNSVRPWTIAPQAPLSREFSWQEYQSGLPFSSLRDLLDPGMEPRSPALKADCLSSEPPGKLIYTYIIVYICQFKSPNSSHYPFPFISHACSLRLCFYFCFVNMTIYTNIFSDSTYMH